MNLNALRFQMQDMVELIEQDTRLQNRWRSAVGGGFLVCALLIFLAV